jgi:hypothetical protein
MSALTQDSQTQVPETPKNDKEHNFAQIRQQLERERAEKQALLERAEKAEKLAQERITQVAPDDDDHSDDPYIDEKRLNKKLNKFSQQAIRETDERINSAVQKALSEERKNNWLKSNPDFYEVMGHAQTFAERDPELAETILSMPEGFERQKLVYKNIKALGIHRKEEPKPSIQDKIEANKRSPYYQPSGGGNAPYAAGGDFTPSGMKNSYAKMQELKARLGSHGR